MFLPNDFVRVLFACAIPDVVVSRDNEFHDPHAPKCFEGNVPTGECVGNVPR